MMFKTVNITEVAAYLEVLEVNSEIFKLFLVPVILLLSWPTSSL